MGYNKHDKRFTVEFIGEEPKTTYNCYGTGREFRRESIVLSQVELILNSSA